jgi:hypothetical protein
MTPPVLPPEIFKAYDIRGVVGKTLTPPIVQAIGHALGSLALERGRRALAGFPDRRSRWRCPTASVRQAPTSSTSAWSPRR